MTIPNPFESPSAADDRPVSPVGTPGPWCDGRYLVVHPYEAQLPAVCLKTGAKHDIVREDFEFPFQSTDPDYGAFTLKLEIPLSKAHLRQRLLIGLLIPLAAFFLGLGGIVLMVSNRLSDELGTPLGLGGVFLVIFSLVFGGWWFLRKPLRPVATGRPYIWLVGAGRAFLEELPPLPRNMQPKKNWLR